MVGGEGVQELDLEEDRPRLEWAKETEVRILALSEPRMEVEAVEDSRVGEREKSDD